MGRKMSLRYSQMMMVSGCSSLTAVNKPSLEWRIFESTNWRIRVLVRHFSPACSGGEMPDRVPERTRAQVISFLKVVCTCPFLQLSIDLNLVRTYNFKLLAAEWRPCLAYFRFHVELVGVTCYITLYVGAKRLIFYLSPRDGHVIIVTGCLILTAVNLIILIWMGNITDRLVSRCAKSIVTFDICLHVCVQVGVRYVITKFSWMDNLSNFVTHGAPL